MRLDELKWTGGTEYWDQASVGGILVQRAKSADCHGEGKYYEVGQYHISVNRTRWGWLDPLEAQAVLYHLLGQVTCETPDTSDTSNSS